MFNKDEFLYKSLKAEFKRLDCAEQKAKKELDEYNNVANEMIAIRKEFVKIVTSKLYTKETVKKLSLLQKRSEKCEKIRKKDYIMLLDKHINLNIEKGSVATEISKLEYRLELRGKL